MTREGEQSIGVQAYSTQFWGLYAETKVLNGYAGVFNGNIYVNGDVTTPTGPE